MCCECHLLYRSIFLVNYVLVYVAFSFSFKIVYMIVLFTVKLLRVKHDRFAFISSFLSSQKS